MIKVHIVSDLHLEFLSADLLKKRIKGGFYSNKTSADILILAGDVTPNLRQYRMFLDYVSKEYVEVVAISGNHEFYGHHIEQQTEDIKFLFDKLHNTTFLDCELKEILGVRIFGGTCWTDLCTDAIRVYQGMTDFTVISYGEYLDCGNSATTSLTIAKWQSMHKEFTRALAAVSNVDIIVSHHIPDVRFIGAEYKSSKLNSGYASRDMGMFLTKAPVWCYGHTHEPSDIQTETTRFICNPVGYYNYEISQYNDHLTFEVKNDKGNF